MVTAHDIFLKKMIETGKEADRKQLSPVQLQPATFAAHHSPLSPSFLSSFIGLCHVKNFVISFHVFNQPDLLFYKTLYNHFTATWSCTHTALQFASPKVNQWKTKPSNRTCSSPMWCILIGWGRILQGSLMLHRSLCRHTDACLYVCLHWSYWLCTKCL